MPGELEGEGEGEGERGGVKNDSKWNNGDCGNKYVTQKEQQHGNINKKISIRIIYFTQWATVPWENYKFTHIKVGLRVKVKQNNALTE